MSTDIPFLFFSRVVKFSGKKNRRWAGYETKGSDFFPSKFSFFLYHKLTDPQADQAFLGDSPSVPVLLAKT